MDLKSFNEINIDISEQNGKIVCNVYIVPIGRTCRTKIRLTSAHVLQHIKAAGYKHVTPLHGPSVIHNYVPGEETTGTWIYEVKPPPKKKNTRSRAKGSVSAKK